VGIYPFVCMAGCDRAGGLDWCLDLYQQPGRLNGWRMRALITASALTTPVVYS